MSPLRRWLRKLIHYPFLGMGFRLVRASQFERIVRAWEMQHDDFYFLQIGAHNGVTSDPFHRFVIEGWWNVVLVEPQPQACQILQEIYRDRSDIKVVPAAIGSEDGVLRLFKVRDDAQDVPYWATQLASVRRDVIASHVDRIPQIESLIVEAEVPCRSLASVFAESRFPRLDLLAVDVEGYDFEVVKQIDQLPQLPTMVYFEHLHLTPEVYQQSLRFLRALGYRTLTINSGDTFARSGSC